ncbi:MAG: sulfate transporter [Gemmatales bacterium]|nr:MAG: sulfate transporter [Gemmatales bacterium]
MTEQNHARRENRWETLRADVLASFVVFLVALPLCMGIAIASGAPPAAGILSGVIGGLVVASLGGSPMQVSGPANSLIVVVAIVNQQFGPEVLAVTVFAAGALQLLAGALRLGQWFRAVSPAVIHGLMTGFAIIIFASQFHVMLDDAPRSTAVENLLAIPVALYDGFFPIDGSPHHWAAAMGMLTVSLLIIWRWLPARVRAVPGSLVAVAAATTLATLLNLPIARVQLPDSLDGMVRLFDPASLTRLAEWPVLEIALTIAFLASIETLLSATAVDQLHQGPRTRYDRELAAQGVGNMCCGLLGAVPLTGVIIRSAANVAAGARTRLSSILHGVWLLAFVSLAPGVLALIPTASLAAVLVVAVVKLINVNAIRHWWANDRLNLIIYMATAGVIVFWGVLIGVAVGIGLSLFKLLYIFSHLTIHQHTENGRTILRLEGAATFIRLPKLAAALEAVPPNSELHVQIDQMTFIDDACLELLKSWHKQHEATGGRLVIDWDSLTAKINTSTNGTRRRTQIAREPSRAACA